MFNDLKSKLNPTHKYIISGYYSNGVENKIHFYEEVEAYDNIQAMKLVIGDLAWKESLAGNSFYLDLIHYE